MADIKSMGLYRNVERVLADLVAAGYSDTDPLDVDSLARFDQYHYEGTDAVDEAILFLQPGEQREILDVGSGLGGPARYIADRTGSRVTALELQPDLSQTGLDLTRRCRLNNLVTHVNGDILAGDGGSSKFAGLVSMLCFLHIPDRRQLLGQCAAALKPHGKIFIDDYFARGALTPVELDRLAETVYCTYLPDRSEYVDQLENAGFTDVVFQDRTVDWTNFVMERLAAFRDLTSELTQRYGQPTVESLDHFYRTVVDLFVGGNLGGVRLTASLDSA